MDVVDVSAGTLVANRLPGVSVFTVLIGPSGSGKSEVISSLSSCGSTKEVSDLTANTFLSGRADKESSFLKALPKHPTPVLLIKDLTTLISKKTDDRSQVMAQLREIHDGSLSKAFGTGQEKAWEGKIGLLSGSTQVYELKSAEIGVMGERFLLFEPQVAPRIEVAKKACRTNHDELQMKADLKQAMKLIDTLKTDDVEVKCDLEKQEAIADLATRIAQLRTPVSRDRYNREVLQIPVPESPGRIAKQLQQLARGISVLYGRLEVQERELQIIYNVSLSSIPSVRKRVLREVGPSGGRSVREIALAIGLSSSKVHRELEDLKLLQILKQVNGMYVPNEEFRTMCASF
jgi:hypothetical protein